MKQRILLFCLFIIFGVQSKVFAIVDPFTDYATKGDEFIWRSAMLTQTMEGVVQAKNMVVKVKQGLELAMQTKQLIEQGYAYAQQVQKDIMSVLSLKDMKWGDVIDITSYALGISTNPKDYIPNVDLKKWPLLDYLDKYNLEPDPHKRADVGGLLHLFGPTLSSYVREQEEKEATYRKWLRANFTRGELNDLRLPFFRGVDSLLMNRLMMKEVTRRKKLKEYGDYMKEAEEKTKRANEMAAKLLIDGFFSMDQGARAQVMAECNKLIYESVEAKNRAMECMDKASEVSYDEDKYFKTKRLDEEIFQMECLIRFGGIKKLDMKKGSAQEDNY